MDNIDRNKGQYINYCYPSMLRLRLICHEFHKSVLFGGDCIKKFVSFKFGKILKKVCLTAKKITHSFLILYLPRKGWEVGRILHINFKTSNEANTSGCED